MKPLALIPALFACATAIAEVGTPHPGPNPMAFTGRVFTLATADPLDQGRPPATIGYPALILDQPVTVHTDSGTRITSDRLQFAREPGQHPANGTRARLDCGVVMGAETQHHFEPLFCGQSTLTLLQ